MSMCPPQIKPYIRRFFGGVDSLEGPESGVLLSVMLDRAVPFHGERSSCSMSRVEASGRRRIIRARTATASMRTRTKYPITMIDSITAITMPMATLESRGSVQRLARFGRETYPMI